MNKCCGSWANDFWFLIIHGQWYLHNNRCGPVTRHILYTDTWVVCHNWKSQDECIKYTICNFEGDAPNSIRPLVAVEFEFATCIDANIWKVFQKISRSGIPRWSTLLLIVYIHNIVTKISTHIMIMDHHSHSYRSRSNQIVIHEYMWLPVDQYPGGGCTSSIFIKPYPLTLAVLQSIELTHSANMIWQDDMWLILLQVSMRFIRFIKSCTKQSIVDACKHACTRATIQFRYFTEESTHSLVGWWCASPWILMTTHTRYCVVIMGASEMLSWEHLLEDKGNLCLFDRKIEIKSTFRTILLLFFNPTFQVCN